MHRWRAIYQDLPFFPFAMIMEQFFTLNAHTIHTSKKGTLMAFPIGILFRRLMSPLSPWLCFFLLFTQQKQSQRRNHTLVSPKFAKISANIVIRRKLFLNTTWLPGSVDWKSYDLMRRAASLFVKHSSAHFSSKPFDFEPNKGLENSACLVLSSMIFAIRILIWIGYWHIWIELWMSEGPGNFVWMWRWISPDDTFRIIDVFLL